MISVHNSYENFSAVKERLYEQLRHPFLMRYIDTPFVDEEKLLVLYSILKGADLNREQIQHYALTIMLVQIALDTHEKVSNKEDIEEAQFHKRRQLTVLAGDYYSGLYYCLLAQNHDIALIRALAEGIKEINEQKVKLYQRQAVSVAEIINSVEIIESSLLQKACHYFCVHDWTPFVSVVTARRRIEHEYEMHKENKAAPIFEALKQSLQKSAAAEEEQLDWFYESYMQNTVQQLRELTNQNKAFANTLELLAH
ncbi:MAG: heptaprenyl diphosphate synthase component 1 [Ectobacillus sp.]